MTLACCFGKIHVIYHSLNKLWKDACIKANIEHINVYQGTRHSSCTQFVNEKGGNLDELQTLTGHKRRDSVIKYAKVNLDHKRRLMSRKVIDIADYNKTATS